MGFNASAEVTSESTRDYWRRQLRRLRRHSVYAQVRQCRHAVTALGSRAWRQATQAWRRLPTAVIVGAQKAGTTQLYASLRQHRLCAGGVKKEISYFSKHADKPLSWYRSLFPLTISGAQQGHCLDASPSYLPDPAALARMHNVLPRALAIAVLRDPVARAFSHYQHFKLRNRDSRTFNEAVRDCIEAASLTPQLGVFTPDRLPPMLDYVSRGYYALQLECLLHFYPSHSVLVLDSSELFSDTKGVCQQVFEFLELPPHPVKVTKIRNQGLYRETLDPDTARRLREHYAPHDRLLEQLLGRRFRWMDRS